MEKFTFSLENFIAAMITGIAFGAICAYYAKKQKKDSFLWFFVGFFLGLFGLLIFFLTSFIQAKRALYQKNKGKPIDTPTPTVIASPLSLEGFVEPSALNTLWYYLDPESKQNGPMSFDAFERDWQQGKVSNTTYIWNEELTEWKMFSDLFPLPSIEELKNKKVSV